MITKVFHREGAGPWQLVPKCMGSTPADPCYTGIAFDHHKKLTTIAVSSSENGQWNFG
jgi:hypothetical protein